MKAFVYYHKLKGGGYRSFSPFPKEELNVILLGEVEYKDTNKSINITSESNVLPKTGEVVILNIDLNRSKLIEIC